MLRKSVPCVVFTLAASFLCASTLLAWSAGPPAYRAGASGDDGTCNDASCHNTYSLNSGSAKFVVTAPPTYTAGKSLKIKVSFSGSTGKSHGFEMTALDAGGKRVGTFKKIGNTVQVIPAGEYRGLKKADKNKYIEHTYVGMKKKQWVVNWTAPAGATDPITFYATGCAADGGGGADKDYVSTATAEISAGASKP